jgi:hypothetical protein
MAPKIIPYNFCPCQAPGATVRRVLATTGRLMYDRFWRYGRQDMVFTTILFHVKQ